MAMAELGEMAELGGMAESGRAGPMGSCSVVLRDAAAAGSVESGGGPGFGPKSDPSLGESVRLPTAAGVVPAAAWRPRRRLRLDGAAAAVESAGSVADDSGALPDRGAALRLARDDAEADFLPARFALAGLPFLWRKMPISLSEAGSGILPHEILTTD